MDPREYRDARWYALVRTAVELGVPEEDAPGLVQQVLDANARAIRRADDPDPLVHAALRGAIIGTPTTRRRWPAVAVLAVALAATGIAVILARPDAPPEDRLREDQVPSLFGYDAEAARELLEDRGLDVTIRPYRTCEVLDRVIRSSPPAGTPYDRGDDIVVYTSLPADVDCLSAYTDRETAWRLLDFANGRGPAPEFSGKVFVYVGLDEPAAVLSAPSDPRAWRGIGVLEALRDASTQVALVDDRPLTYSLPAIRVTREPDSFALYIRAPGGAGSGVRLEVFRTGEVIDGISLYPAPASSP